ncbi:MAG: AMP-binding protein [Bdellovibrionia bacterium]
MNTLSEETWQGKIEFQAQAGDLQQVHCLQPPDWESLGNSLYLNPKLPAQEQKNMLSMIQPFLGEFRGHFFLTTSGTQATVGSTLKWVALSKVALLTSAIEVNRYLQSDSKDVWIHVLPDFHVGGLGIWARSFLSQAQVIKLHSWNPSEFVAAIQKHQGTLASLVPTQVFDLVQQGLKAPSSVRTILVGGSALSTQLAQAAMALGWPLVATYGMTETSSQVAVCRLSQGASSGYFELLPHWEARVNGEGKLQVRGDALLTAIISVRDSGGAQLVDPKQDGWFTTEDRVVLTQRRLEILGRSSDFVKVSGESVDVARLRLHLEQIKLELGLHSEMTILPVPDDRLGHVIHLVSERDLTSVQASHVIQKFNGSVIAFEKIRKWSAIEKLPKTPLGKLIPQACLNSIRLSSILGGRESSSLLRS